MTEKEAILQRHSVRSYENRKIEPEKVKLIREKIDELNGEGDLHLQFLEDAGDVFARLLNKVMGQGSAPSAIACVGREGSTLDSRVGYYGEKLVLYLQQLGLNTCWAGTFNRKAEAVEIADGERLVIVIAVGYGKTQGKPHKSKSIDKVMTGEEEKPQWFLDGVEMALLAPTAVNQQKFAFRLKDDGTAELSDLGGILSQVDYGIVKCHFEIGAGRNLG
ncbi:MAG: nitroreductase family protein [Eubacterium sp.]|nr:nitroreductase family protein [Eubacterium sp.]